MARALGMNPKRLPGLRPSPQQRWKLPVGEFIEECYRKRFGERRLNDAPHPTEHEHGAIPLATEDEDTSVATCDPKWQMQYLVCYLANLSADIEQWMAAKTVDPEILPAVSRELREVARALDCGTPVPAMPEIPLPSRERHAAARFGGHRRNVFDDDNLPF